MELQKYQFIKKVVKLMTKIGIYPGSFDPVTFGHIDLIERGLKLFDYLYIAVSKNESKNYLFTALERKEMLEEITKNMSNVKIVICDKLTSELANDLNATVLIRGLRAVTDFEFELQMASTNHLLNPNIDTVFMMTKTEYSYLSSSMVKEIARFNGDISKFVPKLVVEKVKEKIK